MMRISAAATLAIGGALALTGCRRGQNDPYVPQPAKAIPPATITAGSEASLMPLDKGNQWTYEATLIRLIKGQQQSPVVREWTCKITDSQKTADGTRATMDILQDGQLQDRQYWLVNSKGIYQTASGNPATSYKPMMPVILFPVKGGSSFSWSGTGNNAFRASTPFRSTSTVRENAQADTEMGTVSAIAVDSDTRVKVKNEDGRSVSTVWFAPGTGIVRLRQEALAGNTGFVLTMSLKSKSLMKS